MKRLALWATIATSLLLTTGCASGGGGGGAPWTIRCLELRGPNRSLMMSQFTKTLKRTPGIRGQDIYVMDSSDDAINLYYGTYLRRMNATTGRRNMPKKLRSDLDLIKQLGDESGRRFFLRAIPVRKPTLDVGNPAWDLRRVDAAYSLQVAIFEPNEEFWECKEAAAVYCKLLRDKGYEAYYYHSESSSLVTVGTFGPEEVTTGTDGRNYYSPRVLLLQRKKLLKHNLLNGKIYTVPNDKGQRVAVPSRLVHIPSKDFPYP